MPRRAARSASAYSRSAAVVVHRVRRHRRADQHRVRAELLQRVERVLGAPQVRREHVRATASKSRNGWYRSIRSLARLRVLMFGIVMFGIVMFGIAYSATNGIWPSFYGEMFTTQVRLSSMAIGTNWVPVRCSPRCCAW
jgi:hypothetical protein